MNKRFLFSAFGLLACLCAVPATAQEIHEVEQLSFGTFGVGDNTQQWAIIVTPDNDVFMDAPIVGGQGAQRAEYRLEDFPGNVSFYLGVDLPNPPSEGGIMLGNETPATRGGGPVLYLSDLAISDGGVVHTDNAGDARFYIGGTLRTSGTGQRYDGGTYNGTYTITIYY